MLFLFFRSSITRLSVDDKAERSKAVSSSERDILLHKTIEERKGKQIMLSLFSGHIYFLKELIVGINPFSST